MKIHSKNLSALLGACLLPLLSQAAAPAADPLAAYYDNTLACQNQVSKAVCRVWLNRDGHYYAFYDLGVQAKQPDIDGPRIRIGAEKQRELYSEATCYGFTPHKVGESWSENDLAGRSNKLWLLAGR